jgi:hypothetical protein
MLAVPDPAEIVETRSVPILEVVLNSVPFISNVVEGDVVPIPIFPYDARYIYPFVPPAIINECCDIAVLPLPVIKLNALSDKLYPNFTNSVFTALELPPVLYTYIFAPLILLPVNWKLLGYVLLLFINSNPFPAVPPA